MPNPVTPYESAWNDARILVSSLSPNGDIARDLENAASAHFVLHTTVDCIKIIGVHQHLDANYEERMTEFVEAEWPDEADLKSKYAARRLLKQPIARNLLSIVWKESCFVPECDLIEAGGKSKVFSDGQINCRRLALALTDDKEDIDANEAQFRRILKAASKLNLVEHVPCTGKKRPVTGTKTLDEFMRDLARSHEPAILNVSRDARCDD